LDIQNKKGHTRLLVASFLKKSFWKKEELQLPPFSIPVQFLINNSKVFEDSKNKKEVENDLLSIMAPLTDERCSFYQIREISISY
jgi:hypothetical protein